MVVLRAVDSVTAAATERASSAAAVLLLGAAINQDGRSSSLTAPNGPSQQALIRSALSGATLPPAHVNLLSMHGTGEDQGDPGITGPAGTLPSFLLPCNVAV